MALLNFEEELARSRNGWAFSNGFEFESWSSIWCDECEHVESCPLLLVMLDERIPAAWEDRNPHALNRYHCQEFQRKAEDEASPGATATTTIVLRNGCHDPLS